MTNNNKRNRETRAYFVMVTYAVLDSPAWKAMSMGARCLYITLRRQCIESREDGGQISLSNNGRVYLPQSKATKELGTSPNQIVRWFRELEHYGFIVMMRPGHLGLEGHGRAAMWRLTELACGEDPPTNDFMRWNGVKFSQHNPGGDHLKRRNGHRYGKPGEAKTESHYEKA
jgi:hypothetical protein